MATSPRSVNQWNAYYYDFGEGERCLVTFDVSACDRENQGPSSGRRLIGFSPEGQISPQGMPSPSAFARLTSIEGRMLALLSERKISSWLVGRQLYRGMRELIFQVGAPHLAAFDDVSAQIEREFGGTKLVPYEGWKFFNDRIAPDEDARAHIANREILAALKQHGADLSKEHLVDHTFVGPIDGLVRVVEELSRRGFERGGSSERHVTFSARAPLDQDAIDVLTRHLRSLARHASVSYDGWGTALDRR